MEFFSRKVKSYSIAKPLNILSSNISLPLPARDRCVINIPAFVLLWRGRGGVQGDELIFDLNT